jgi:hypothetical protein
LSVELNGFRIFTVDYAAKHVGDSITLYARQYSDTWPKKSSWTKPANSTYVKFKFTPNGDAIKEKTRIEGWLKSQKPAIKKGTHFYVDGPLYLNKEHLADGVQVDSSNGKTMSVNLMNTEVFVKV